MFPLIKTTFGEIIHEEFVKLLLLLITIFVKDWGEFSDWSTCTNMCGGGIQWKVRSCVNGVVGVDPECPDGGEFIEQVMQGITDNEKHD